MRFLDRFPWLFGRKTQVAQTETITKPLEAQPPPGPPPTPVWLSDLLSAFSDAAFRSIEPVRAQHLADMEELYEKSSDALGDVLKPKTMRMAVTPFVVPAEGEPPPLEVPIAAVMQSNPLAVDEIKFDIECRALSLRKPIGADPIAPSEIEIGFGAPGSAGCLLRLSVRYKSGEPPQAQARIGDALVRGVE